MVIGIIQCGDAPPSLVPEHGPYGAMVARLVEGAGTCRVFDATRSHWPADVRSCDAYVLTGSPAGVYEEHAWIADLAAFLRDARGKSKLVGICFGHQMLAQTFGGKVIKSPRGWGIGVHRYDVVDRSHWMDDSGSVAAPASHQDQVVACPPDARVLLSSAFTPFAALDYGYAISFQCHPEFTTAFGRSLIELRREVYGAHADAALASYDMPDDRTRLGQWITIYLRSPRREAATI